MGGHNLAGVHFGKWYCACHQDCKQSSQSVSQTWSLSTKGHLLISIVLTVFGAGLCAFIVGWLVPTYVLWPGMYAVTLAGYLAVLGIAWFPITEKPGEHSFRHPHFIGGAVAACGAIVAYTSIL